MVGREGVLIAPPGWLAGVAGAARRHGALFVADEVFTGFGRSGRRFAVDHDGVRPDLICCGKALGGGLPIGAVVGERRWMEAWRTPGEALHTGTFVAWLGGYGSATPETHSASQAVVIPAGSARYLNYWRFISATGAGSNVVTFSIDGEAVATEDLIALGADSAWTSHSVDVSEWADGATHTVGFEYVFGGGATDANYYLDDVTLDCTAASAAAPARPAVETRSARAYKRH